MNTQRAYEKIRAYFTRPGAVLAQDGDYGAARCLYRTAEGNACAVGCLIPKSAYRKSFEGLSVRALIDRFPAVKRRFAEVNEDFLLMAQSAHDGSHSVEGFVKALDRLAKKARLELP